MPLSSHIPDPASPWFFAFFVAMWFIVTGLLAILSGWSSLATHWREHEPRSGTAFRFASGSIGAKFLPVSYSNCLTVTVSEQGLGLSILFPFRFMSPPIFIPWSQVSSITDGKSFFVRHVLVQPRNHWARIKLHGKVVAPVLASSSGRVRGAA